jgi:hypothetical protein
VTDGHEIDARLQEMDGRAVPQAVRVEPLSFETGNRSAGAIAVFCEEIPHAESSQRRASVIDEEWLCRRRRQPTLADVGTEQLGRLRRLLRLDGPSVRTLHVNLDTMKEDSDQQADLVRISGNRWSEFPEPTPGNKPLNR